MKYKRFMLFVMVGVVCVSLLGCATASRRTAMDDQTIAERIKASLESPMGPPGPFSIQINVYKGIVSLDGQVPSDAVKAQVIQTAHTTEGVQEIKSYLRVQ
ncbi:MAG TPA: BON domain-containing protein [bacterium]|nr:BON domain-containing protein [Candidatus Omnitrophota bacterium]HOJ61524.1 BON domain-containing protein [bacterium]HOL93406.1 BON domain-containing protein [bacterium]HPP02776.1 BON domain-containing protein [bacterium]HXK96132.1 BON domain-containing protein [bacterium]